MQAQREARQVVREGRRAGASLATAPSGRGHELRTPIHSILTISQFRLQRLDGEPSDEQNKQVRIIRNTARDLSQFIDDLLDLAKAQAGKVPVRAGTFAAWLFRDGRVFVSGDGDAAFGPIKSGRLR